MRLLKLVLVGLVFAALAGAAFAANPQPGPQPVVIGGIITAIDLDAKSVAVGGPPGSERPTIVFFVNERTVITKDGSRAGLNDLAINDECVAKCVKTSDGKLVAVAVRATTPKPPLVSVHGTITAIDLANSIFKLELPATSILPAKVMSFLVDRGTAIRKDGKVVGFGDLKVNDLAAVAFVAPPPSTTPVEKPIRAVVVEAQTPPDPIMRVVGKLVRIGEKRVIAVLPPNAPAPLLFQVTDDTKIIKMKPVSFDALLIGDTLGVAFKKPAAGTTVMPNTLSIEVLPEVFAGLVVSVDPMRGLLSVQKPALNPTSAVTEL